MAARDTRAAEAAQKLADDKTTFWDSKLRKALGRISDLLKEGQHTVTVKVASGPAEGARGAGIWEVPNVKNPDATPCACWAAST